MTNVEIKVGKASASGKLADADILINDQPLAMVKQYSYGVRHSAGEIPRFFAELIPEKVTIKGEGDVYLAVGDRVFKVVEEVMK